MAASKKKTKGVPSVKHNVAVALAKKPEVKKAPAKKSAAVAVPPRRKNGSRAALTVAATSKTKPRKKKSLVDTFVENLKKHPVAKPEWKITMIFGHAGGVFGLATDQRVYRWNTRSAVWVLHKEGLSATQQ